jgi:hypothetical protein
MVAHEEEGIQVELPGFKGKAMGKQFLNGKSSVVLVLGLLLYLGYLHHTTTNEGQQKTLEALDSLTYVLSLPQSEREKLSIAMPESLRRKIRRD